jgi:molecular chaperone GrpE
MTSEEKHEPSEIEKQLEAEKKRSEDCINRMKYLQADFENLKKRCDRQLTETKNYATERLVMQLLEVADELEMAINIGSKMDTNAQQLLTGVEMTLKKLRKVLEQEGVTPIECQGKPFDPVKHNAIESVEREGTENCTVNEEVRKGYMMKEKVIRPSIVKVEVPPSKSQTIEKESEENE